MAASISLVVTDPKSFPSSPTWCGSLIVSAESFCARSFDSFLSFSLYASATAFGWAMRLTCAVVAGTASERGRR